MQGSTSQAMHNGASGEQVSSYRVTSPAYHCCGSSGLLKVVQSNQGALCSGYKGLPLPPLLMLFLCPGGGATDQQDQHVHHQPLLHEISLSSHCEGDIPLSLGHAAHTSHHTQNQGVDFTTHMSLCSRCPALKLMELLDRVTF